MLLTLRKELKLADGSQVEAAIPLSCARLLLLQFKGLLLEDPRETELRLRSSLPGFFNSPLAFSKSQKQPRAVFEDAAAQAHEELPEIFKGDVSFIVEAEYDWKKRVKRVARSKHSVGQSVWVPKLRNAWRV